MKTNTKIAIGAGSVLVIFLFVRYTAAGKALWNKLTGKKEEVIDLEMPTGKDAKPAATTNKAVNWGSRTWAGTPTYTDPSVPPSIK